MMMFRTVVLAALVAPLAFGEYSYTYDYTDAPTASPTAETMSPTTSGAPTRTETYAPTRMTETPSYAPTTDTYAPTQSPTATDAPTVSPVPTPRPTYTTECIDETFGQGPYPPGCYNTNQIVPGTNERGTCNATGTRDHYRLTNCPGTNPQGGFRGYIADCSPTGANCTMCGADIDVSTGSTWLVGCCNYAPVCG